MESVIEALKDKINIVDFVNAFVPLKKAGRNFKGICPFHQEKTPSFIVSPERQLWRCFGACGTGGDVIAFFMKWENISFPEAIQELAEQFHVPYTKKTFADSNTEYKQTLIDIHSRAGEFYHYILTHSPIGKGALEYLLNRGINKQIVETFQLGYSPSSWDSLTRFLKSKRFSSQEVIDSGLVLKSQSGALYDRFRGRIMFPLKDHKGNTLGFSGRILSSQSEAKYVNSPETLIYHKRAMLFGFHLSKEAVRKKNSIILVEGEFDMITPYQSGIENIAAIKGTSVTVEQLQLIKRYTNRVYLALDADAAGEEAVRRTIDIAEPLQLEIGIITIPAGKDPDEAVKSDKTGFIQSIKKSVPVYDFLLSLFEKRFSLSDPFGKKKIAESMAPYIASIQNPIIQSYYIKQIAKHLDVSEESVHKVIYQKKKRKNSQLHQQTKPSSSVSRIVLLQRYIIEILLHDTKRKKILQSIQSYILPEIFTIPALSKIYVHLKTYIFQNELFDINTFASSLSDELRSVVDELYLHASAQTAVDSLSLSSAVLELQRNTIKTEIQTILQSKDENKDMQEKQLKILHARLKELEKIHITV